jgi:signal peptidase I
VPPEPQELLICGNEVGNNSEFRDRIGYDLIVEALRAGHETRIRVTGTSMIPAIWPGDVLKVSPSTEPPIAKGNIVLSIRGGRLFAHRVVGRVGAQLITRGDAVNDCDPPVSAAELLGVVVGIIRLRGTCFQPVIPSGLPSSGQRLVAFAVRHSRLAYRVVLKWHKERSEGREVRSEGGARKGRRQRASLYL